MSTTDEILDIVSRVSLLERDTLTLEAKITDFGITSLDMVEIICELEDKFAIDLPFNANLNIEGFRTLGDVIRVVEETIAGASKTSSPVK